MNPSELFTHKRLDLVIKYLFAKDIIAGTGNVDISSLYKRHILLRTSGKEPVNAFGSSVKNSIDDYTKQLNELIINMSKDGFDPARPIPVTADGLLANGAHRIAAALALGLDVDVETVETGCSWDFEWFDKEGFSVEDKQRLLKGFVDINPCGKAIMIVWNPLFKHLDHVRSLINKKLDIVGEVELDFENNFIAFKNILLDIYEPNGARNDAEGSETILAKAELLNSHRLGFKVIVLTNQEKSNDKDIHEVLIDIKKQIRELFDFEIPKSIFATVHTSDSKKECKCLADILLSPNNIKHLKMRLDYKCNPNFNELCDNLKLLCDEKKSDSSNICVIGSAVLEVLGIMKGRDIDFIVNESLRKTMGNAVVRNLKENIDLAEKGPVIKLLNGSTIHDDAIINNSEFHFIFRGLKFANLDIIKIKKQLSAREKDIKHVRLIELFENFSGTVNQDQLFKSHITKELERRGAVNYKTALPFYEDTRSAITGTNDQPNPTREDVKALHGFISDFNAKIERTQNDLKWQNGLIEKLSSDIDRTRKDLHWLHDYFDRVTADTKGVYAEVKNIRSDLAKLNKQVGNPLGKIKSDAELESIRKDLAQLNKHVEGSLGEMKKTLEERRIELEKRLDYIINFLKTTTDIRTVPKAVGQKRQVQLGSLQLLRLFDKICRENNLKYWLDFGTLLGAVRHGGFVPWDDDIDVGMMQEDYEKFCKIAMEQLDDSFACLNKPPSEVAKLVHKNFNEINYDPEYPYRGWIKLMVDIFPYFYKSNECDMKKLKDVADEGIALVSICHKDGKNDVKYNSLVELDKKLKKLNKSVSTKEKTDTVFLTIGFLSYNVPVTYSSDDLFPLQEINFEGLTVFVPGNYHKLLTTLYGDYYTYPSIMEFEHTILKKLSKDSVVSLSNLLEEVESYDKGDNIVKGVAKHD